MKKIFAAFSLVTLLISAGAAIGQKADAPALKDKCPVCGMFVSRYPDWVARIEFRDGTYAVFDGPKDMFRYYLDIKKFNPSKTREDALLIVVKDYYVLKAIDAQRAFFVIGSDIYGPMGNELIPFQKEPDAKEFMKDHKGKKILRFKDITLRIVQSLDGQ